MIIFIEILQVNLVFFKKNKIYYYIYIYTSIRLHFIFEILKNLYKNKIFLKLKKYFFFKKINNKIYIMILNIF